MSRFGGRQAQFQVDLAFGAAFAVGFGYLMLVEMNPLVVAFEGGLVLGYFLRVGENMLVYERILEEEVAEEAETQVADEVEAQLHDEVEAEVEDQVADEVTAELEARVPGEVEAEVKDQVADEVESPVHDEVAADVAEQVHDQVEAEVESQMADVGEHIDEAVEEHVTDRD